MELDESEASPSPPPPPTAAPLFGVVIAGRPVITDFAPVGDGRCVATVASPADVSELSFFLLPHSPVPAGHGAVLHYTCDGAHWQALGAVDAWSVKDLRWFSPLAAAACSKDMAANCQCAGVWDS